ncbi:MAG: DUF2784 domain-containing protein [Actinomycetota bacterium]|nr:DUF2784 domain-containing protein [Actinomycetota bacterium]
MLPAYLVAVVHGAAVVLLLSGALLALRWPVLLLAHVPVTLAIAAVFLAGVDCPLTRLELALRAQAGGAAYRDGFLSHYLLAPLSVDVARPATQAALPVVAVLPNAVAYALLGLRRRRRRSLTGTR